MEQHNEAVTKIFDQKKGRGRGRGFRNVGQRSAVGSHNNNGQEDWDEEPAWFSSMRRRDRRPRSAGHGRSSREHSNPSEVSSYHTAPSPDLRRRPSSAKGERTTPLSPIPSGMPRTRGRGRRPDAQIYIPRGRRAMMEQEHRDNPGKVGNETLMNIPKSPNSRCRSQEQDEPVKFEKESIKTVARSPQRHRSQDQDELVKYEKESLRTVVRSPQRRQSQDQDEAAKYGNESLRNIARSPQRRMSQDKDELVKSEKESLRTVARSPQRRKSQDQVEPVKFGKESFRNVARSPQRRRSQDKNGSMKFGNETFRTVPKSPQMAQRHTSWDQNKPMKFESESLKSVPKSPQRHRSQYQGQAIYRNRSHDPYEDEKQTRGYNNPSCVRQRRSSWEHSRSQYQGVLQHQDENVSMMDDSYHKKNQKRRRSTERTEERKPHKSKHKEKHKVKERDKEREKSPKQGFCENKLQCSDVSYKQMQQNSPLFGDDRINDNLMENQQTPNKNTYMAADDPHKDVNIYPAYESDKTFETSQLDGNALNENLFDFSQSFSQDQFNENLYGEKTIGSWADIVDMADAENTHATDMATKNTRPCSGKIHQVPKNEQIESTLCVALSRAQDQHCEIPLGEHVDSSSGMQDPVVPVGTSCQEEKEIQSLALEIKPGSVLQSSSENLCQVSSDISNYHPDQERFTSEVNNVKLTLDCHMIKEPCDSQQNENLVISDSETQKSSFTLQSLKELDVKNEDSISETLNNTFSKDIEMGSKSVEIGSETLKTDSKSMEPMETGSKPVEMVSKPLEIGSKSVEMGNQPMETASQPMEMGTEIKEIGSKPMEMGSKSTEYFDKAEKNFTFTEDRTDYKLPNTDKIESSQLTDSHVLEIESNSNHNNAEIFSHNISNMLNKDAADDVKLLSETKTCTSDDIKNSVNDPKVEVAEEVVREPCTVGQEENMEAELEADSWDAMFNEDGEAIDPKLMDELTAAVGKVKVHKPQFDYYNYQPKDPELDEDTFGHLIEIYDFPTELITRDIIVAFKDFMDRGFDVKWVDDTHAIGVFASSVAAQAALTMRHPLLKVRPISQASRPTKLKAKRTAEFLTPYRPRPETTAAVARNLVTGALGLSSRVPREKRQEERKKLQQAKEKKRNAAKQKSAAWEGFGKCAMDEV